MESIRRATETEARAAFDELIALLTDVVDHGASVGFLRPLPAVVARDYWNDVLAGVSRGSRVLLIAREASRIVGSAQLDLCGKPNGVHRAEVQKVIVERAARGRGLGRALMDAIEREARAESRTLLYLDTEPGHPAERMYQAMGWRLVGDIPDYARNPDGELRPTRLYFKRIG